MLYPAVLGQARFLQPPAWEGPFLSPCSWEWAVPLTLQVGPVPVPDKQLHSPGTSSCLQLSSLCTPANSHTPGISPAACPPQPPCLPGPNPPYTCSSSGQPAPSPPRLHKAWGGLNKTDVFHASNSQLPLISWQIRRD